MPLANDARPSSFDEMVGNQSLIGPCGILRRMLDTKTVQSCIFWGPPGIGKTCAARILAEGSGMRFAYVNATTAGTKELKEAIGEATPSDPVLLYLDEVQYFNKRQQQTLLSMVEDGSVTLVAATTENPYHDVYKALLSRCLVIEFEPIAPDAIAERLRAILRQRRVEDHLEPELIDSVAHIASGDLRRALNLTEAILASYTGTPITTQDADALLPNVILGSFDTDGDIHYSHKAALQKSIRGSDPDAAIFWLMKLLEGGDIASPMRRMMVIASEDVGLADPFAVPHTLACCQAAERLGLPEARYPLAQAAIYLALAPKANSIGKAFSDAIEAIHAGIGVTVPAHIAQECPKDYIYPHDLPFHWADQRYLPDGLAEGSLYRPQTDAEKARFDYWAQVRNYIRSQSKN